MQQTCGVENSRVLATLQTRDWGPGLGLGPSPGLAEACSRLVQANASPRLRVFQTLNCNDCIKIFRTEISAVIFTMRQMRLCNVSMTWYL